MFLAAFGGSGPEGPRTQRTVVALLWFSTAVGRSVGSASARSEIVPVAVESLARPAAYRWVRGPSGPLSGRHSRRVSAVHTPRSYRRTPHGRRFAARVSGRLRRQRAGRPAHPAHGRCLVVVLYSSWQVGGERIGPQRDRAGGSREPRQAGGVSLGARAFWPAFRKTQPARQRRPHPTVVPSHPPRSPLRGACFWPPSAAAGRKARAPSARSLPCCGSLQHLGRSVGSASARSEIVPVAVESLARPAAYRWVRGPSGPLSGRHSRRVSAVHTPRSYRRTPHGRRFAAQCFWPPSAAADQKVRAPSARSLPCCGSLQQFGRFGGERIGPQRDRLGGSREPRQAGGVSLGARAFWPAFRKTQPARQRRPYPTVVPLHPAVAASRRSVSGRLRRQRTRRSAHPAHGRCLVVVLYSSWQVGGKRIGPQRERVGGSREPRQTGGVSLGARAFWPAFRKTQPARQRRPYPTVVPLHPAVAASRRGVSGRLRRQRTRRSAHPARGRCRVVVL